MAPKTSKILPLEKLKKEASVSVYGASKPLIL